VLQPDDEVARVNDMYCSVANSAECPSVVTLVRDAIEEPRRITGIF
jgi:hypothetical protein